MTAYIFFFTKEKLPTILVLLPHNSIGYDSLCFFFT